MSSTPRPVSATPPSPAPLIAPTGSPGLNSVIDVVNVTAAPFQQAPPAEQGAAGWVSQGLGGVLGVIDAPAQIIDTAFASLTAPIAALFPALPACTIGALHVGMPHAHTHPPSCIPPAPPVPLPSIGMVLGSCAITVHICGLPAARAGDIGISITCGSLAPPFEIFTGSSNVFVGGSRAARMLDITQHCNPMSMGAFAVAMGAAGVVAGAAGAVATGNSYAAAQAAADAAVLVFKMLCGKDPGIPPGWGLLLGPGMPNVLIGGFPCPPIGEMAIGGLMKKLAKGMRALKAKRNAKRGNAYCANGSHPIYLPTGENFDHFVDFVSGGLFEWRRYVSSARVKENGPHGPGWRHSLQRSLSVRLNRAVYTDWDGERFEFPRFRRGSDVVRADGYVLQRVERGRYRLSYRDEPAMEFAGGSFDGELPLVGLHGKQSELRLERDGLGRLCTVEEQPTATPEQRRRWELRHDAGGRIVAIDEVGVGGHGAASVGQPVPRAWFAYDDAGNLVKAVDALGGVATYEYDSFHRVTKQTDARGYSYSFKYDVWGRCTRASGMDGLWACRVEYFTEQGFTRYTEGDDATWEYHYEPDGFVTRIVDPYGGISLRERGAEGQTLREIDSAGRRMDWLYDADGAHHARRDHLGFSYPPELELAHVPNPFAREPPTSSFEWAWGEIGYSRAIAAQGPSRAYFRSMPAELAASIERVFRLQPEAAARAAAGPAVETDALGRVTRQIDARGRSREWAYDPTGNVVALRDRDGRLEEHTTTSWNLLGTRSDALGHALRYRYSKTEQVIEITDPLGSTSRYDYDLADRLVRVHRHGRVREEYVFEHGHFVEKKDGRGETLFCNEIHDNHLVALRRLASGGFHRFDYDRQGRLVEASTHTGQVRLSRDFRGRRTTDVRDGLGIRHQHGQSDDRRTRVFDKFELTETATSQRRAVTVIDATQARTTLHFDHSGMVIREAPSGTTEILQYDEEGRLEGRIATRTSPDGRPQSWEVRYSYSAEGDLLAVADNARGTTVYEVDAAHRLIGAVLPDGRRASYELDEAGNLLSKPGLDRAELTSGNRLVATEREQFEHDHRDHVSSRRLHDGSVVRYTYDSFDMLVRIEHWRSDDQRLSRLDYEHDALGRRTRVRADGYTREFYWDGDRLAAEVLPDARVRIYCYVGMSSLVPIGFTDYEGIDADPRSGKSYSVYSDPVGMPLHIEDSNGTIVWWADRADPYGALEVHEGNGIEYNLRWPGHYYDPETGLHSNRYRVYDPRLGRYLQSDPIGYAGSEVNLYAYPANPLTQVDLFGLHPNRSDSDDPSDSTRNPGMEGTRRTPSQGGDASAPRRGNDPLGDDGLTDAQRAHFRDRIDNAANDDAANQARYDRNCCSRENRGLDPLEPSDWQSRNDRIQENAAQGAAEERATLDALGVQNNNHGDSPSTFPTPDGNSTRPDAVTDDAVIDVKSMPDSPDPDGGPRVLHNSDQLRGQANAAGDSGRTPVVVMTNGNSSNVRPSGPLAEQSTVLHRDSNTGKWSEWDAGAKKWQEIADSDVRGIVGS